MAIGLDKRTSAEEGAVTRVNQEQQCLHETITIVMIPAEIIVPSGYSPILVTYLPSWPLGCQLPHPPETAVT